MDSTTRGPSQGWSRAIRFRLPWHMIGAGWQFLVLLALGLSLRLGWIMLSPSQGAGEASNVAIAFAKTGEFADAYFIGSGPTAHLMPTTPMVAGLIFKLFGISTPTSNGILFFWCLAQVLLSFVLLFVLFRRLGTPIIALLGALTFLSLVPVYIGLETFDFRFWEGASAVCLGCISLIMLVSLDGSSDIGWRHIFFGGLLAAVTFFVSPTFGLGIYAASGIFAFRNFSGVRLWGALGAAVLIISAILTPWVVRNINVLHAPIVLRDNLGLEMNIANVNVPMSQPDPLSSFRHKMETTHPVFKEGRERLEKAGGEIAYQRIVSAEVHQWIRENPVKFARLSLRHLGQFFFPQPWQFRYTGTGKLSVTRSIIISTISLLGMFGLFLGLWQRRPGFQYLAATILITSLPYMVVQPIPRYTYVIYGLLLFLAADGLLRVYSLSRKTNRGGLHPNAPMFSGPIS
jgi:hypothetical protein